MTAEWEDHRHALPIATVFVTEMRDQIALLKENADENVCCGRGREQQVTLRHARRSPKCEDKTQVQRMTNVLLEGWGLERSRFDACPAPVIEYLLQSEQFEVVDQKRGGQQGDPS